MASIGNPCVPSLSGCGPTNHPTVAVATRMASITIVAVMVPETVITPPCQVLTGPSVIGGT